MWGPAHVVGEGAGPLQRVADKWFQLLKPPLTEGLEDGWAADPMRRTELESPENHVDAARVIVTYFSFIFCCVCFGRGEGRGLQYSHGSFGFWSPPVWLSVRHRVSTIAIKVVSGQVGLWYPAEILAFPTPVSEDNLHRLQNSSFLGAQFGQFFSSKKHPVLPLSPTV